MERYFKLVAYCPKPVNFFQSAGFLINGYICVKYCVNHLFFVVLEPRGDDEIVNLLIRPFVLLEGG